jgi:cyclin B
MPSLLATTSVLFAINLLDSPQVLPSSMHFNHNPEELKQCIQEMLVLIQGLVKGNLTAIKRKYSQEKHNNVAELVCSIVNNRH